MAGNQRWTNRLCHPFGRTARSVGESARDRRRGWCLWEHRRHLARLSYQRRFPFQRGRVLNTTDTPCQFKLLHSGMWILRRFPYRCFLRAHAHATLQRFGHSTTIAYKWLYHNVLYVWPNISRLRFRPLFDHIATTVAHMKQSKYDHCCLFKCSYWRLPTLCSM